jgi:hypothetical protein
MIINLYPYYLCITSGISFINIGIYLFKKNKDFKRNILAIILFTCLFLSQLFWINPIQNSLVHKLDAFVAKITTLLFFLYVFYKNYLKNIFYICIILGIFTIISFYRSNYYSNIEWCCNDHLFNHGLLHTNGFFISLYVFI